VTTQPGGGDVPGPQHHALHQTLPVEDLGVFGGHGCDLDLDHDI